jgi:hypothetical protein
MLIIDDSTVIVFFNLCPTTIPPISTKPTIITHLKLLNTKITTIYDVENPSAGLE